MVHSKSRTEEVEVKEITLVTVWVVVVEGLGMDRHEHAEDSIGAAKRDSAGGSARGSMSRLAGATVGVVSSEVVNVTVVVVTLLSAKS